MSLGKSPDPIVSVIIPVFGAERTLEAALEAVEASDYPAFEVLVTNDGSRDASRSILEVRAHEIIDIEHAGPAAARNRAVRASCGEILFFTDADVVIAPDTIRRGVAVLHANPGVAAVFGSYAAHAGAGGFFTAYKNYVHHFTHQQASPEAFTFWTGCGFIRRSVFDAIGGFDESQRFLSDVELGYRMHLARMNVRLEKTIEVVHHKHYDLGALIRSDFFGRAIPWTRLMMHHRTVKRDLNLRPENIASVPLSFLLLLALLAVPWLGMPALLVAGVGFGFFIWLNRAFFGFVRRREGAWFTLRTIAVQWVIYLVSGVGLVAALLGARSGGR